MLQISVFFTVTTYNFSKVPKRRAKTPNYKNLSLLRMNFLCHMNAVVFSGGR